MRIGQSQIRKLHASYLQKSKMKRITLKKDQLYDLYLIQDMSASKIAEHV